MSRIICPYTSKDELPMVCIMDNEPEIDCDKCNFKKEYDKENDVK